MKYAPTNNEMTQLSEMCEDERFTYCLTRMVEAEEIWGLAENEGWILKGNNNLTALPIWPYKSMAEANKINEWQNAEPQAISLEYFVYTVSQMLMDNDISVEIFPTENAPGKIMQAKHFFKVLENLMEAGEYFMEG